MQTIIQSNLIKYRLKKRYSRATVARLAGISIETCRTAELNISKCQFLTVFKICRALDVPIDKIILNNKENIENIWFHKKYYRKHPSCRRYRLRNRLRIIRENLKKTQRGVAENAEISLNTYYSAENNRTQPTVETALRIAKSLGVSVDKVFILDEIKLRRSYKRKYEMN